ncbi:MAG: phosphodiester glycosidase family protein [Rhizobiales bacterium]|nr:phosphodiester glycosidase family protein [Hyphomicrobiales bacterium]
MTARRRLAALLLAPLVAVWVLATSGRADAACSTQEHEGNSYDVCRFDPAKQPLELFNLNEDGEPIANFSALAARLAGDGKRLTFAMNAGMFDDKLRPIGLYVERGQTLKKLNRRNGFGNFHLKPNGVFLIAGGKAAVMDTEAFVKAGLKPDFATQSGPMLVINGRIHPKFSETGTSAKVRNGVGVTASGEVVFVLSENAVTFHRFARFFRDALATPNALFLDGTISSLYSTDLRRNDGFLPLGPMVGAYEAR